jgi:hypothetical protein|tara:strand:- start:256 stop:438 length:183 start_codon:yes stop_codon:yes gene_type:complete
MFNFSKKQNRILHLSWFAFFLSFVGAEELFTVIACYAAFVLLSLAFLKPFHNLHRSFQKN